MHTRRFAVLAVATAVAGFTTAARRPTTQGTQPPIAGIYRLVTIDGRAIPVAPVHPGAPANVQAPEVLASTMILRPDGSFIMAMAYRNAPGRPQYSAQPFSGTYAPDSDAFVARWDGAGSTRLTLANDTLVMNNEGMLFAYRKIR